jgi:hypothetical protein
VEGCEGTDQSLERLNAMMVTTIDEPLTNYCYAIRSINNSNHQIRKSPTLRIREFTSSLLGR